MPASKQVLCPLINAACCLRRGIGESIVGLREESWWLSALLMVERGRHHPKVHPPGVAGSPLTLMQTLVTELFVAAGQMPLISAPISVIPCTGNELELFQGYNGETNLPVVSLLNCSLLP